MNASAKNEHRLDDRKRFKRWYFLAAITFLLTFFLLWLVSRGPRSPSPVEQKVLDGLVYYGVQYELDKESHVVRLILEGGEVTDTALLEIDAFPNLKQLSLANSSVTDQGMLTLVKCKELQLLGIANTPVTDIGLGYLAKVTSLQKIWVTENDKLTSRGVSSLQRALPFVKVHITNKVWKEIGGQKGN